MLEIVLFLWGIGKGHNEEFSQANAGRRMPQVASTGRVLHSGSFGGDLAHRRNRYHLHASLL
jgi:hypothetical protein